MTKKTVYEELFNYKINEDDIATISGAFVKAQKHAYGVSLKDMIVFYKKRINLDKFLEILEKADKKEVELPIEKLKELKFTRNDFLNITEGWLHATINNMEVSIKQLEYFAKTKVNLVELIDAIIELKKHDRNLILRDFVPCSFCINKIKKIIPLLIELKENDTNISLKNIISKNYSPKELNTIINLYKISEKNIPLNELILNKNKGYNIEEINTAYENALKNDLQIDIKQLFTIDKKNQDVVKIVEQATTAQHTHLDSESAVLSDGLQILFKIDIKTKIDINKLHLGLNEDLIHSKVSEFLKLEVYKYPDFQSVYSKLGVISDIIYNEIKKIKTPYNILSVNITDIAVGKNLKLEEQLQKIVIEKQIIEEELKKIIIERKVAQEKAIIVEATLKIRKAEIALAKIKKHKENHSLHKEHGHKSHNEHKKNHDNSHHEENLENIHKNHDNSHHKEQEKEQLKHNETTHYEEHTVELHENHEPTLHKEHLEKYPEEHHEKHDDEHDKKHH